MGYWGVKLLKRESFFRRRPNCCRRRRQCCVCVGMGVMMWAERSPATYSPHGRGTGFGRSCELLAPTEGTFSEMGSVCRSAQHDPEQHDSRHGKGLLHTHLAARSS